jgi:asparagine synthase (glutamine-hydrolysing)
MLAPLKMRGTKLRVFPESAFSDLLPNEIKTKKKQGFGLPTPIWLRTHERLNDLMHELVLSPRSLHRRYFRKKALEDLVQAHKTDETSF